MAADGDTYVDSGLGWYAFSDCVVSSAGTEFLELYNGTGIRYKYTDGSAICAYMSPDPSDYTRQMTYFILSTVKSYTSWSYGSGDGFSMDRSTVVDGVTWYYGFFNGPFHALSGRLIDYSSSWSISDILSSCGVTTDSSVLVPPEPEKTHVLKDFNNSPLAVSYRPSGGSLTTEYISGELSLANDYDNSVLSVSDLNTFNNGFSAGPMPGKSTYQYLCYRSVDFKASEYSGVHVSGDLSLLIRANDGRAVKPYSASLYVNGYRVGSSDMSYNSFLGDLVVDTTLSTSDYGDIETVGIWVSFNQDVPAISSSDVESLDIYFVLDDNLAFEGVAGSGSASDTPVDNIETDTGNIFTWIRDIFQWLLSLPSALGDLLLSLFIPSESDLINLHNEFEDLLNGKLGFVGQAGDWLLSFFGSLKTSLENVEEYTIQFPGISFPMNGTTYQLVESQTVNLDNDFMAVVRPVLGSIVIIVSTLSFINLAESMVIAVTSGASYFDFLKGRRD